MPSAPFAIVPLSDQDRTSFDSGVEALDRYLRQQAGQDMKRRVAACFVAVDTATGRFAGYYTLSACHLMLNGLDLTLQRKLPKYPTVPAVRLGRLAVDRAYRGRKLGAALLANAIARAVRSDIAAALLVVDAKDETAAAFYRHFGFRPDPEEPLRLYASLAALASALAIT